MKNRIVITVIMLLCMSLAVPSLGYSGRYYGPYRGCYGCGYRNDYWVPAAVVAGSILVGAIVIGAIAQSSRQQVASGQASYGVTGARGPYAAPDPDFIARYGKKETPGEWVIIPGQQVGDRWVPAHRVFVPDP